MLLRCVLPLAAMTLGCIHTSELRKEQKSEVSAPVEDSFETGVFDSIQRALISKGYKIDTTGDLDEQTRRALEDFQREQGLAVTGLPDRETLRLLGLDPDKIYDEVWNLAEDEG